MRGFLAAVHQMGNGLAYIQPLSPTDPGFGTGAPPVDPGYGRPDFGGGNYPSGGPVFPGGPVDPGYGQGGWGPVDPGYGQGGWNRPDQGLPGYGHPDHGLPGSGGRPSHPIVIPAPPEIQPPPEKPIVIPKPSLPPGSGVVIPMPEGVVGPSPTVPGTQPYILWYGPGTDSSVVYLAPPEVAAPK